MLTQFVMNGYLWKIFIVPSNSPFLIDRTNTLTLATTDPRTQCVYISNGISGNLLYTVLIHELAHCAMFSYYLVDDIHRKVNPKYWIEAEEWVCNFMADYGFKIFEIFHNIFSRGK